MLTPVVLIPSFRVELALNVKGTFDHWIETRKLRTFHHLMSFYYTTEYFYVFCFLLDIFINESHVSQLSVTGDL